MPSHTTGTTIRRYPLSRLVGRLFGCCLAGCLAGWLVGSLFGLAGWSVGWSAVWLLLGWLVGWLVGRRSVGWLVSLLFCSNASATIEKKQLLYYVTAYYGKKTNVHLPPNNSNPPNNPNFHLFVSTTSKWNKNAIAHRHAVRAPCCRRTIPYPFRCCATESLLLYASNGTDTALLLVCPWIAPTGVPRSAPQHLWNAESKRHCCCCACEHPRQKYSRFTHVRRRYRVGTYSGR